MADKEQLKAEYLKMDFGDDKSEREKIKILESRYSAVETTSRTWYDLVCGTCGNRCCRPCTANGNWQQCAQTMFANCSICGHASSGHYAAYH